MPVTVQLGALALLAAFLGGFFYGRMAAEQQFLRNAAAAARLRGEISHDVEKLDAVRLCRALGGLRADCRSALRGGVVGKPAAAE